MIDLLPDQQPHHLDQPQLDGIGVLERRQRDVPLLAPDVRINFQPLLPRLLVVVTKFLPTQGGRSEVSPEFRYPFTKGKGALSVGDELSVFVSYDRRLLDAAEEATADHPEEIAA